jgi:hypothetical protein
MTSHHFLRKVGSQRSRAISSLIEVVKKQV